MTNVEAQLMFVFRCSFACCSFLENAFLLNSKVHFLRVSQPPKRIKLLRQCRYHLPHPKPILCKKRINAGNENMLKATKNMYLNL